MKKKERETMEPETIPVELEDEPIIEAVAIEPEPEPVKPDFAFLEQKAIALAKTLEAEIVALETQANQALADIAAKIPSLLARIEDLRYKVQKARSGG